MSYLTDPDFWFRFLCRKYAQRADPRQQEMGLQYTTAETGDLAKEIASEIARWELAQESEAIMELYPVMCAECGKNWADLSSALCPGCEAYQEHTR